MLSRWIRTWHSAVLRPLLEVLARLGITANMLTVASLGVVIIAAVLLRSGYTALAAWLLLFGGFLDGLDGELARITGGPSPFGGFLDSICDHCGDFAIYLGLLWLSLQRNDMVSIMLIFVALFGSVFGSHVRSRAAVAGIDTKAIGLFTRAERTLVLMTGLLIHQIQIALWILAIFNNLSAMQRVVYAVRNARQCEEGLRRQET